MFSVRYRGLTPLAALSLKLLCFEYLHRHAKNFTGLREALPTDLYEEYQRFV